MHIEIGILLRRCACRLEIAHSVSDLTFTPMIIHRLAEDTVGVVCRTIEPVSQRTVMCIPVQQQ